jgi:hypothetical protein
MLADVAADRPAADVASHAALAAITCITLAVACSACLRCIELAAATRTVWTVCLLKYAIDVLLCQVMQGLQLYRRCVHAHVLWQLTCCSV